MRLGLNATGLNQSNVFSPQSLFTAGEQGAYFEAYNPDSLLKRRNMLLWTEKPTNTTAWDSTTAPVTVTENADGAAFKIVPTAAAGQHYLFQKTTAFNPASARVITVTVKAKNSGYGYVGIVFANTMGRALFNLFTGNSSVIDGTNATATTTSPDADGYRLLTFTLYSRNGSGEFRLCPQSAGVDPITAFTGDGVSGVLFKELQVEYGSVATPYQKVTDWTTEYLAAASTNIGMWQDSAGTTPVTAVEQPVGFWRDTKRGTALEPELVPDGGNELGLFDGKVDGTAVQRGTWNWSADRARTGTRSAKYICTDGTSGDHLPSLKPISAGVGIDVSVWVYNPSGNFSDLKLIDSADGSWQGSVSAVKDQWVLLRGARPAKASAWNLSVGNQGTIAGLGFVFYVDDISIRELPGNHATQGTSASRPTLSARYNLLTKTEQFDDAVWTKGAQATITANQAVAPDGVSTADRWDAASGGNNSVFQTVAAGTNPYKGLLRLRYVSGSPWVRVLYSDGSTNQARIWVNVQTGAEGSKGAAGTATFGAASASIDANGWVTINVSGALAAAGTGYWQFVCQDADASTTQGAGSFYVWGADLRTASDAALNIPAYQRVNTATDYDTEGFPHYLKFDGVDDSLSTGSIDFSATDKMTVWAGVTKLSDAALGMLVELTTAASSTPGGFYITAPSNVSSPTFGFLTNGTVTSANQIPVTYAAPINSVLSSQFDNSGATVNDQIKPRINGVLDQEGSTAGPTSPGAYANAAMYIGRRGGSALPFNGRLTTLAVRGAASNTTEIARMEQVGAAKNGQSFVST